LTAEAGQHSEIAIEPIEPIDRRQARPAIARASEALVWPAAKLVAQMPTLK
jgi:hypothetical protein